MLKSIPFAKIAALALAGFLLGAAVTVRAEEQPIKVQILVILATDQNKKVDGPLMEIAQKVKEKEPSLTGFQVKRRICAKLSPGMEETFKLLDDQSVTVLFKCKTDEDTRCCLTIKPPLMGEITYNTACSKFLPIITRYQTKDKERLIIAIMVPPCESKKKK